MNIINLIVNVTARKFT
jgi:hypothetical protein